MRRINRSTQFKKDFKRVKANPRHSGDIDELLMNIVVTLARDEDLPERCRDHDLVGEWAGCRECHVKPDLLLIYEKPGDDELYLSRLGSHSELFKK